MMHRWLIEGVCGTGKSSVLAAMQSHYTDLNLNVLLLDETQTFGELMTELNDANTDLCWRLDHCLRQLHQQIDSFDVCILERFHPSYYAQLPETERYSQYDQALADLGFCLILLDLPEPALKQRSLYRNERESENWIAGNIEFYGSETQAIQAFQLSQQRRRDYLNQTGLPFQLIDTQSQNWAEILSQILNHRA